MMNITVNHLWADIKLATERYMNKELESLKKKADTLKRENFCVQLTTTINDLVNITAPQRAIALARRTAHEAIIKVQRQQCQTLRTEMLGLRATIAAEMVLFPQNRCIILTSTLDLYVLAYNANWEVLARPRFFKVNAAKSKSFSAIRELSRNTDLLTYADNIRQRPVDPSLLYCIRRDFNDVVMVELEDSDVVWNMLVPRLPDRRQVLPPPPTP